VKKIETIEWHGIIMEDDILDGIELREGGIRTFNSSTSSNFFGTYRFCIFVRGVKYLCYIQWSHK